LRAVKHFFRSFDFTSEVLGVLKQTPHSEALSQQLSIQRQGYLPTSRAFPFPAFCRLFSDGSVLRRKQACLLMVKKILPQSIASVWIYWYNHERSKKDQRKIKEK
jgi:hypothetical protein